MKALFIKFCDSGSLISFFFMEHWSEIEGNRAVTHLDNQLFIVFCRGIVPAGQLQGFGVRFHGLIELAFKEQDIAHSVVSAGIFRIQPQCLRKAASGTGQILTPQFGWKTAFGV